MNRLEELLIILSEECAEVSQASIKCVRFGMDTVSFLTPGGPSNRQKLETELGDLLAMIKLVLQETHLNEENVMNAAEAKLIKVGKFMRNGKPPAPPSKRIIEEKAPFSRKKQPRS